MNTLKIALQILALTLIGGALGALAVHHWGPPCPRTVDMESGCKQPPVFESVASSMGAVYAVDAGGVPWVRWHASVCWERYDR